jgi:hypothetical protein
VKTISWPVWMEPQRSSAPSSRSPPSPSPHTSASSWPSPAAGSWLQAGSENVNNNKKHIFWFQVHITIIVISKCQGGTGMVGNLLRFILFTYDNIFENPELFELLRSKNKSAIYTIQFDSIERITSSIDFHFTE